MMMFVCWQEANNSYRQTLSLSSSTLLSVSKRLGSSVEKARPYYDMWKNARKIHVDCQRTAVQYHRANGGQHFYYY